MKKLLLIPFTIFFISCTNSDEKFGIWMKENNGLEFTSEHMDFLVSEYGEPIDTISDIDKKIPNGFSMNVFYGPEFIDIDESNYIIDEFNERLRLGESYTNLMNEYKSLYMAVSGVQPISQYSNDIEIPWTVKEFINEYQRKISEFDDNDFSFESAKDSISKFFKLEDERYFRPPFDLNSITYRFKTITTSSKDYWPNTDNPKEIDVYRDVKITDGKINFNEGMFFDMNGLWDENWCISEKSKRKITNNVVGDWVFRKNGRVVSAYKFFEDYSFSMSSASGTLRGGWSINCNGQISRTEQGGNTINIVNTNEIEENGIYYLKE